MEGSPSELASTKGKWGKAKGPGRNKATWEKGASKGKGSKKGMPPPAPLPPHVEVGGKGKGKRKGVPPPPPKSGKGQKPQDTSFEFEVEIPQDQGMVAQLDLRTKIKNIKSFTGTCVLASMGSI